MEETDQEISNLTHLFEHGLRLNLLETRRPREMENATEVERITRGATRG